MSLASPAMRAGSAVMSTMAWTTDVTLRGVAQPISYRDANQSTVRRSPASKLTWHSHERVVGRCVRPRCEWLRRPAPDGPPPAVSSDLRSAGVPRWSYHIEAMRISERWWRRKRQTEELTRLGQRLNNLGSWGWELVAYEATPMTSTFTHNIKGYAYLALFKRPQPASTMTRRQLVEEEEPTEPECWPVDVLFPSDNRGDALLLCKTCGCDWHPGADCPA